MLLAPEERNTTNDRYQNHRTLTYVEESEISEVNNNTKNYERFETLKLLNQGGALTGNKLVSLSCSGGEASLVADLSEKTSLRFDPFSAEHHQRIDF